MYRLLSLMALFPLALSACDRASDKEQREYMMMLKGGASPDERCAKLHQVAAALLKEENASEYQMAKLKADSYCLGVQLDRMR